MPKSKITEEGWFEVTLDLLFLDGQRHLRGDQISQDQLGLRATQMVALGMIRAASDQQLAA